METLFLAAAVLASVPVFYFVYRMIRSLEKDRDAAAKDESGLHPPPPSV